MVRDFIEDTDGQPKPRQIEQWMRRYLSAQGVPIRTALLSALVPFLALSIAENAAPPAIAAGIVRITDIFGAGYEIIGEWETEFDARVLIDREQSRYRWS